MADPPTLPLPASWNAKGLNRRERGLLQLASVDDAAFRRRQRLLVAVGLWFLAAAFVLAAVADLLHWSAEAWTPMLAVPGLFLLVRAWDVRNLRTTRRVLRRLCGQQPD